MPATVMALQGYVIFEDPRGSIPFQNPPSKRRFFFFPNQDSGQFIINP